MLTTDHSDGEIQDGEVAARPLAPVRPAHDPVPRHGYEAPGSSRVVGIVATAATCALVAFAFLATLSRFDPPPTVSAPVTMSLLPLPSEERPRPKAVEKPEVAPRTVAKPVPHETAPPPIVLPPLTASPAAPPQPVAVDAAPPRTEAAPTPSPSAQPAPPVQASHGPDRWEGRVLARLERFRRYPADAQRARQQGTATIRFRIDRDGHVLSSALERSSGYPALDAAAMETLRRADPLPKIPPDRPDQVELVVPVEFSIGR